MIATGSRPREIKGFEFAHILNSFGVEVTVVELLGRLLPLEDEESSPVLTRAFKQREINVLTSTRAKSIKKGRDGAKLFIEEILEASVV